MKNNNNNLYLISLKLLFYSFTKNFLKE